jgi:hypothetical protein
VDAICSKNPVRCALVGVDWLAIGFFSDSLRSISSLGIGSLLSPLFAVVTKLTLAKFAWMIMVNNCYNWAMS